MMSLNVSFNYSDRMENMSTNRCLSCAENGTNATVALQDLASFHQPVFIVIPLMMSCVVAVISNTFVCYLISTVTRLKTPTNMFIFSLCICNMLFAGVLLPFYCYDVHSLGYQYLVLITVLTYIGNLTAVTYERQFSITHPFRYQREMTKKRALKIVVVAWMVPLTYCFLPMFWSNRTDILVHKVYITCTLIVFLVLPLVFILFVYIKVCLEIKRMYDYYQKVVVATGNKKRKHQGPGVSNNASGMHCLQSIRKVLCGVCRQKTRSAGVVATTETAVRIALSPDQEIMEDFVPPIKDILSRSKSSSSARSESGVECDTAFADVDQNRNSISCRDGTSCTSLELISHSDQNGYVITDAVREHKDVYHKPSNSSIHFGDDIIPADEISEFTSVFQSDITENERHPLRMPSLNKKYKFCARCCPRLRHPATESSVGKMSPKFGGSNQSSQRTTRSDKRRSSLGRLKHRMNELKASFAFAVVAFTYMFTWLPVVALTFLQVIERNDLVPPGLVEFSIFAIAVNSLSDPFLYGLLLKNFRVTIKLILRKFKLTRCRI